MFDVFVLITIIAFDTIFMLTCCFTLPFILPIIQKLYMKYIKAVVTLDIQKYMNLLFSLIFNVKSEAVVRNQMKILQSIFHLRSPTSLYVINNHFLFLLCFGSYLPICEVRTQYHIVFKKDSQLDILFRNLNN